MKSVYRLLPAILAGVSFGSAAMAVTPLQSTATANPAAATSGMVSASVTGASATATTAGSVSASPVQVAKFNTATGILVGATVAVNVPVAATGQVTGTVLSSGGGRRVTSDVSLTGTIAAAGVTFSTPGALAVSHFCTGGNCPNSAGNQTASTAGSIVGSSAVAPGSLASYAGVGTVAFTNSATGTTKVTTGSGALTGTANGLFTFGGTLASANVYSITYDFLNFANPSFNGSTNLSALTLDFGTLFQNSAPVTINFSLYNIGNINSAGLSLTSIGRSTNDANFTTSLATFTNGLDGGNSLTYSMTFNPLALGLANDLFTLTLADFAPGGIGGRTYQLTANAVANVVAAPPTVVPEPATWAMLVLGFGLVGVARRRRTVRATAA